MVQAIVKLCDWIKVFFMQRIDKSRMLSFADMTTGCMIKHSSCRRCMVYSRSACNCLFCWLNSVALSLVDAQQAESSMPGMHACCFGLSKEHAARGTLNNQDVYSM